MSIRKYKFVSPGIFVNEIDNSHLPAQFDKIGPVVIGRTQRGPALRPVKVQSFSEFVEIFGDPIPGGQGGDVWRDGNKSAATYASYAAQAWLRNNGPITVVRLLGAEHGDRTSAGRAGWIAGSSLSTAHDLSTGGAFGIFVAGSGTTAGDGLSSTTGTLSAIVYLDNGSVELSGAFIGATTVMTGAACAVQSVDTKEWTIQIKNSSGTVIKKSNFNFTETSDKYIRKVLNTNPSMVNTDITRADQEVNYWLGETFERNVTDVLAENAEEATGAGKHVAFILGLEAADGAPLGNDFQLNLQSARTGWFISQDVTTDTGSFSAEKMTKLFKFHSLGVGTGEWDQRNLKISIEEVKKSTTLDDPYGSFTVSVRKAKDSDKSPQFVERYSNCNLNPNSLNYVARKIGDRYVTWDDSERRYREYGNYDNVSKFIRINMNADVDAGSTDATFLPFGVFGPTRYKSFTVYSGSTGGHYAAHGHAVSGAAPASNLQYTVMPSSQVFAQGGNITAGQGTELGQSQTPKNPAACMINVGAVPFSCSIHFPKVPLRLSASDDNMANPTEAYFGAKYQTSKTSVRYENSMIDLLRAKPVDISSFDIADETEYMWVFTLDDLRASGSSANHTGSQYLASTFHESGSRANGHSFTAKSGTFDQVLSNGFDRFTSPLFGGFDGTSVKEKDPFRNELIDGKTQTNHYAYNSVKRAIDCVKDPEVVEFNLASVPGLYVESLTGHLINVCEQRADALAIIDLKGGFKPAHENDSDESARIGSVDTVITNLRTRGLNTSYGCAYYPWVQIRDNINGTILWVPPSVAAMGTMASSENKSELWFAPAGFTRGGLTEGSAGLPVVGIRERLTSKQRDQLYDANVNPIASFPAEGIVIFGQKTLQTTPSALDRVNVRRLMIFLKKEISRKAATILFDQNVQATWMRFLADIKPFLDSVKARLGLQEYKVILDETTTTPDLIDRNILYAKIFLKPARAIEYIAIDFVITDSGASFED